MRTILTALFLCFAILLGIAESASGASTVHGSKTASGDFWENPNICTYKLGSLELEPCRGDTIVGYDSATGVLYYVRQNPWTYYDPYGLEIFGYDTFGDYAADVGSYAKGYFWNGPKAMVTGTIDAVVNYEETGQALKTAVTNPVETGKAVVDSTKQMVSDLGSGDMEKAGEAGFNVVTSVLAQSKAGKLGDLKDAVTPDGKTARNINASTKNMTDAERVAEQLKRRATRRENESRDNHPIQKRSGEGFRAKKKQEEVKKAQEAKKKAAAAKRKKRRDQNVKENRSGREKNVGIDEEHSKTPKGDTGGQQNF